MAALHTPLYFHFVHCADAPRDGRVGMAMRRLGLERLAVCPVAHSFDAWAIALLHREGWSIVYSGDTRPCEGVVRLGRSLRSRARILVHEATFDDAEPGMRREAEQRKHSTVAEALEVGNQMGAWRVLLTHFSNRYPRLADVRAGGAAATRTVPAFDLMEVPFQLLPTLPALMPALTCLFAHDLKANPEEAEAVHLAAAKGGKGGKGGKGKGGGKGGGGGKGKGGGKGFGGGGKGGSGKGGGDWGKGGGGKGGGKGKY